MQCNAMQCNKASQSLTGNTYTRPGLRIDIDIDIDKHADALCQMPKARPKELARTKHYPISGSGDIRAVPAEERDDRSRFFGVISTRSAVADAVADIDMDVAVRFRPPRRRPFPLRGRAGISESESGVVRGVMEAAVAEDDPDPDLSAPRRGEDDKDENDRYSGGSSELVAHVFVSEISAAASAATGDAAAEGQGDGDVLIPVTATAALGVGNVVAVAVRGSSARARRGWGTDGSSRRVPYQASRIASPRARATGRATLLPTSLYCW